MGNQSKPASPFWGYARVRKYWVTGCCWGRSISAGTETKMMSYRIRIWKKAAFPSLLFLIAAVYLFGSAFHLKRVVRSEQKQSFDVTVSINREEDVQALLAMKEVKGGSALYEIPATISSGIYSSDLVIQGIDSSMIPGIMIEGARYAEAGSMPYLILNEAALKTFITDDAVTFPGCEMKRLSMEHLQRYAA